MDIQISCLEVYQGKEIPDGKKSITFRIQMRAEDHTMTNEEAQKYRCLVIRALKGAGYEIRGIE